MPLKKGKSRGLCADNSPVEALNHRKIDSVDSGSRYLDTVDSRSHIFEHFVCC